MRRVGLIRPGMLPVCGPSSSNGIASEKETPRCTAAAPRRTASGVMKFNVPRWSSGPQRPQFETRAASCLRSWAAPSRQCGSRLWSRANYAAEAMTSGAPSDSAQASARLCASSRVASDRTRYSKNSISGHRSSSVSGKVSRPGYNDRPGGGVPEGITRVQATPVHDGEFPPLPKALDVAKAQVVEPFEVVRHCNELVRRVVRLGRLPNRTKKFARASRHSGRDVLDVDEPATRNEAVADISP